MRMSSSDLTSIPLPVEPISIVTEKKTAREMLQEALRDHKISLSKDSNTSSKHISSKLETSSRAKIKISGINEMGESSQSIVDELFKDFIAQKFTSSSRDTNEATDEKTISRVRSSASEISKILDMEINSIISHTENKDMKQQSKLASKKYHKSNSSSKQSEFNPTPSPVEGKVKNGEDLVTSQCDKQSKLLSNTIQSLISESVNRPSTVKIQSSITDSQPVATASEKVQVLNETSTMTPSSSVTQVKDTSQPQANVNSTTVKRNMMLPVQIAKKMMPPKVLGVKLSTESLSLITSTDRIDRDGRVWEEGEVHSSQSERSEKESDSEAEGFPSDSGSLTSNTGDWKTQTLKHKKKHKHKHKKKKKKAKDKNSKEKDNHTDKEKKSGKDKSSDEKDKDKCKTLIKNDKEGNTNTTSSKDRGESGRVEVKEVEKMEVDQSKGDRETRSREKDKSSDREHDGSRKRNKEADNKRKKSHSRSKSPKKHKRSKSRSRTKSPKRHGSRSSAGSSRYSEWDARLYSDDPSKFSSRDRSRSRSKSKEHSSERRRRSRDNSQTRERGRSKERQDRDLRLRIDKAKLRKIAIANALQNMKAGQGQQVDLTVVKSGGKSVEELTEFCKRISEKGKAKADGADDNSSDEDVTKNSDDEELLIHHPFKVKDAASSGIIMNIKNAKQLPVLTPSEKQAQQATLRLTFPVSSGSHHRASESEWVPVVKTPAAPNTNPTVSTLPVITEAPPPLTDQKQVDSIFPHPSEAQKLDIGSIISERLKAVRKLQENPYDIQALSKMHQAQEQASKWAASRHLPGQFTGSTGASVLSQEQLIGNRKHQAWVKKTQISQAAPVNGGIGMFLLQKMGWKQGEGLGKNNEGSKVPLMLDIKVDRKGLTTATENPRHKAQTDSEPRARDLSNKHPVSALMELCNRRRWGPPLFTVVEESGPDHKKNFLFKVKVNNVEYQPAMPSTNKKMAKAQCAAICLQEMGLLSKDAPLNI